MRNYDDACAEFFRPLISRCAFMLLEATRVEIKNWSYAAKLNLARHLKLI